MDPTWRHLPPVARPVALAVTASIAAAQRQDTDELAEVVRALTALDQAQVGLVSGTAHRLVLERRHPDGLTGDDVRAVLTRAAAALPEADPSVLLALITGALGLHDEEVALPPEAAGHAACLIADLWGAAAPEPLVDRTFQELRETQLND